MGMMRENVVDLDNDRRQEVAVLGKIVDPDSAGKHPSGVMRNK
jgi:hypothetical protein